MRSAALILLLLAPSAATWLAVPTAAAVTIWEGPSITFTKVDFADPFDPANRDILIPGGVEISRGDVQGLVNYAQESFYSFGTSPADTEWAFVNNNPTETLAASNYLNLSFDVWFDAHGQNPPSTVGQPAVLHILSADIYIDITFTAWTQGLNGGGFSYTRSSPVPEPSTAMLLACGLLGLVARAQRSSALRGARPAGRRRLPQHPPRGPHRPRHQRTKPAREPAGIAATGAAAAPILTGP